jgi:hypothetical protein
VSICTKEIKNQNDGLQEENTFSTDLEPIYGTTVDNGRELADIVPETIPNRTHSQYNVQLIPHYRHKQIEEGNIAPIRL